MNKLDYLEKTINDLLYELNFCKAKINENSSRLDNASWQNLLMNSDFKLDSRQSVYYLTSNDNRLETKDKWFLQKEGCSFFPDDSVSLEPDGIFGQEVKVTDFIADKILTLSFNIRLAEGDNLKLCCLITSSEEGEEEITQDILQSGTTTLTFHLPKTASSLVCGIKNTSTFASSFDPYFAKLEIGEVPTLYLPPMGNQETLRCMDGSIDIYKTVYDKNSPLSEINWGFLSGIVGGKTILNREFSMFSELRVYSMLYAGTLVSTIDLSTTAATNTYAGGSCTKNGNPSSATLYATLNTVNLAKTSFTTTSMSELSGSSVSSKNNNSSFYVFKIEGKLRKNIY